MNPLLQAAIGSIIRFGLAALAGHLVKAGVWTSADASMYVGAATLGVISLGWSLYLKVKDHTLPIKVFGYTLIK